MHKLRADAMIMYQVYICEYCGKESKSYKVIEACEAAHFGLTVEEKLSWDAMKLLVEYLGSIVLEENNERTRATYDNAIEKLVAFEQLHGIYHKYK